MSRSGYTDDCDGWELIRWRGAVKSAIRGKRGQAFLREMLAALDALPVKRLIDDELVTPDGEVCALGAVALKRQVAAAKLDPYDREQVAATFGISPALAAEIADVNDDNYGSRHATPEQRFAIVRAWVVEQLAEPPAGPGRETP